MSKVRHYRWPWRLLDSFVATLVIFASIGFILQLYSWWENFLFAGAVIVLFGLEYKNKGYLFGKDKLRND